MKIPFVGVLIEPFIFRGIKSGDTGRENLEFYEKGGEVYGLKPCYFRLEDIEFDRNVVRAYIKEGEKYQRMTIPIPAVIHNRAMLKTKRDRKNMRMLLSKSATIFNSRNRYGKWYIHRLLDQNTTLRPNLPETYLATSKTIERMMRDHEHLIIKPENGSIGKGILKLDRLDSGWRLTYPTPSGEHGQRWNVENFRFELPSVLKKRIKKHFYIVQERIPLATYQDAPFDMRVSVQRNHEGEWQVSGIVAKVAKKGHFLTNVARGGSTNTLERVLDDHPKLQLDQVKEAVGNLSLEIARYLGKKKRNLADLGLDIGITNEGKPYFIECNARDLRITFRNANMIKEWERTHTTPMGYASYLIRRNLER